MKEPQWILRETVLALQERLLSEFGGLAGVHDAGLLDSALHARMGCKDSPPTTLEPCKPRAPLGRCSGAAAVVRPRSAIASASA